MKTVCLTALGMLLCKTAFAQEPLPTWKLGDGFHLKVERFAEEGMGGVYDVHAIVLGTEKVGAAMYWKLDFLLPNKLAPADLPKKQRVLIDSKDGWPRHALIVEKALPYFIENFGTVRFLMAVPKGFPLEILPNAEPFSVQKGIAQFSLSSAQSESGSWRIGKAIHSGGTSVEVRQLWIDGEKWWKEYERFVDGKPDLKASIVPKVAAPAPKKEDKPKAAKPAAPKGPPPKVVVEEINDPLARDSRLSAKVTIKLRHPRIDDILKKLDETVGIRFEADEYVDKNVPVFADAAWVNVPAWSIMKQVAKAKTIDGRWEKTAAGYRLLGQAPAVSEGRLGKANLPLGLSILGGLTAIGLVGWWSYRRYATRPPSRTA